MKLRHYITIAAFAAALVFGAVGAVAGTSSSGRVEVRGDGGAVDVSAENADIATLAAALSSKLPVDFRFLGKIPQLRIDAEEAGLSVEKLPAFLNRLGVSSYATVKGSGVRATIYVLPEGEAGFQASPTGDVKLANPGGAVGTPATAGGRRLAEFKKPGGAVSKYVADSVLVRFASSADVVARDRVTEKLGLAVAPGPQAAALAKLGFVRLSTGGKDAPAILRSLRREDAVRDAELDYVATVDATRGKAGVALAPPSDPSMSSLWYVGATGFDQVWQRMTVGAEVKVAVIDTGVDSSHTEMTGRVDPGFNFVAGNANTSDDNGHGTFVAGIIGANRDNGEGIAGLYPFSRILPVKAMDAQGSGTYSDISAAIVYSADNGAKVINLSLSGDEYSRLMKDAVDYAILLGCVVVAAAGNDWVEAPRYPAAFPGVIGAGALDQSGNRAYFSDTGFHVDVMAPGVSIYGLLAGGGYTTKQGTSFATPIVASMAAVLLSERGGDGSVAARLIAHWPDFTRPPTPAPLDGPALLDKPATVRDVAVTNFQIEANPGGGASSVTVSFDVLNKGELKETGVTARLYRRSGGVRTEIGVFAVPPLDQMARFTVTDELPAVGESFVYEVEAELAADSNVADNARGADEFWVGRRYGGASVSTFRRPIRQWLAGEASRLLPDSGFKHESYDMAGMPVPKTVSDTMYGDGFVYGYDGTDDSPDLFASGAGGLRPLVVGAGEEEGVRRSGTPFLDARSPLCGHFWNPDLGTGAGGLTVTDPAHECYGDPPNRNGLARVSDYYAQAVADYRNGLKARAYYWLGAAAGVLADLGIPAHVLNDVHDLGDSYEDFLGDLVAADGQARMQLQRWSPSGAPVEAPDLAGLVTVLTTTANRYDSTLVSGKDPAEYLLHNPAWETQYVCEVGYCYHLYGYFAVSKAESVVHGDALVPLTLRTIAGLYAMFGAETDAWRAPLAGNSPPLITPHDDVSVEVDTPVVIGLTGSDPDGGTISFSVAPLPAGSRFDSATNTFRWTPGADQTGTYPLILAMTDGEASSTDAVTVTVRRVPTVPVLSPIGAKAVSEGATLAFNVRASDADLDALTFGANDLPAGAAIDPATGAFSWIPGYSQSGVHSVTFWVTDSVNVVSEVVAITVANVNTLPVLDPIGPKSVDEGVLLEFTINATDVDGDILTFSASNLPTGAVFSPETRRFSWTPNYTQAGSRNVRFNASDGVHVDFEYVVVTVTNVNRAPSVSGNPPTSVAQGYSYSFLPSGSDPDTFDSLTWSIVNKPQWASFSTVNGRLYGTPGNADVGVTVAIAISVRDSYGASAQLAPFDLAVTNVNDAPTISGTPPSSVAQGSAYSFTPAAGDVDVGDVLSFSITNKPAWASFDTATGTLSGVPANGDVGVKTGIVIRVRDLAGATATLPTFSITVTNVNDPPAIWGVPATAVAEDTPYTFVPTASDPDVGDSLSFAIANKPPWATFNPANGALTGTPSNSDVGTTFSIVISAVDASLATASLPAFDLAVTNVNDPPVISGVPPTNVAQGSPYAFTPTASDPDAGDPLLFSISNKPPWAVFDSATGRLDGTPGNGDVGTWTGISINVRDGAGAVAILPSFAIAVANVNDPPVIVGAPVLAAAQGAAYSFAPTATDPDVGDSLTFSISNKPPWASFDPATGTLGGTPGNGDVGTWPGITISARDLAGAVSALPAFTITVANVNDPPAIGGAPPTTAFEDASYSFTPFATDVDVADMLAFAISGKPAWAGFDPLSGTLSGVPGNGDVGTFSGIVISVSDASGASASLPPFSVTVVNVNDAPTIAGTPQTAVDEDSSYSFVPTAADADPGDTLVFSIVNKPGWADFDTASGALTGTPRNGDVGTTGPITIAVADSSGASASLPPFSIAVGNVNDPPVISGTPVTTAVEDAAWTFSSTAQDVDPGDTLTFSIANGPPWASLDPSTGVLAGTPGNGDVGLYAGILISVSDGAGATATLPPFDLTVANVNDPPAIWGVPPGAVDQGSAYLFVPSVTDPDRGDSRTFSVANKPVWATFDPSSGALGGTPANADVGVYSGIAISVRDSANAAASLPAFSITVSNVNDPPSISGAPPTEVSQGGVYEFIPVAVDVDAVDSLAFSIEGKPAWAAFDMATGRLSGTPTNADVGVYGGIALTVADSAGATASLPAFQIAVANVNDPPTISGAPPTTATQGIGYEFVPSASDVDLGDALIFSIAGKPAWCSFDPTTGRLSGTPANADVGVYSGIAIFVRDSANAVTSLPAFSITVSNVNDPPSISGAPPTEVSQGGVYEFIPVATDIDAGDSLAFSIEGKPTWAAFDTATGRLSGTPTNADVGVYGGIALTVADSARATASLPAFQIAVANVNDPPAISGDPATIATQGIGYEFVPSASDVDLGDALIFSIAGKPAWCSFDPTTGRLSGTPANADVGVYGGIVVIVSDLAGATAGLPAFSLTVANVNDPPSISGAPPTEVSQGGVYEFSPVAVDVDAGDTLIFSISGKPAWTTFIAATGRLSGTPTNADVGVYPSVAISASDSSGATASLPTFQITVANVNDPPSVTGVPPHATQGAPWTFAPVATDPDRGDAVTLEIANKPAWTAFNQTTGELTGTPANADVGSYRDVLITARDSTGATASLLFDVTVENVNDPPAISGDPATSVFSGADYSFLPIVSDPDPGEALVFSITNKPTWAAFDASTGRLHGTPGGRDAGVTGGIVIAVSDSAGASAALAPFAIEVIDVNDPPTLAVGGEYAATEGVALVFAVIASDPDTGDLLTLAASGLPEGATFDVTTGAFAWTPEFNQAGTYAVEFSVSDGEAAVRKSVTITVANANRPPALAAASITTVEGVAGSAQLSVEDADVDDTRLFSVGPAPAHGIATVDGSGRAIYLPEAGFTGSDSFGVTVADGSGATAAITVPALVAAPAGDTWVQLYVARSLTPQGVVLATLTATGDLFGNGPVDMVVGEAAAERLLVYRGDGAGGFAPPLAVTLDGRPVWVVLGDADSDGRNDVLVGLEPVPGARTGASFSTVATLVNTGQTLSSALYNQLPVAIVDPTAIDVNGDGAADYVSLAASGDGLVAVSGDFTVLAQPECPGALWFDAADYDGDGSVDLACRSGSLGKWLMYGGDGRGGFAPDAEFDGPVPVGADSGDMDGDGDAELAALTGDGTILELYSSGGGSFGLRTAWRLPEAFESVAIGDFDGDSHADLLLTRGGADHAAILLGGGDLSFWGLRSVSLGGAPAQVSFCDLNGDGLGDFTLIGSGGALTIAISGERTAATVPEPPPPPKPPGGGGGGGGGCFIEALFR